MCGRTRVVPCWGRTVSARARRRPSAFLLRDYRGQLLSWRIEFSRPAENVNINHYASILIFRRSYYSKFTAQEHSVTFLLKGKCKVGRPNDTMFFSGNQ
jgi:hypothetical protein